MQGCAIHRKYVNYTNIILYKLNIMQDFIKYTNYTNLYQVNIVQVFHNPFFAMIFINLVLLRKNRSYENTEY